MAENATKATSNGEAKAASAESATKQDAKEAAAKTTAANATTQAAAKEEKAATCNDCGQTVKAKEEGTVAVISKSRAGKKIIARTGKVIEFDSSGKATVSKEDAKYLSGCPGFSFE